MAMGEELRSGEEKIIAEGSTKETKEEENSSIKNSEGEKPNIVGDVNHDINRASAANVASAAPAATPANAASGIPVAPSQTLLASQVTPSQPTKQRKQILNNSKTIPDRVEPVNWYLFHNSNLFMSRMKTVVVPRLNALGFKVDTPEALTILNRLAQINDVALGIDRVKLASRRPFPKFPAHLLMDCEPNGAIIVILEETLKWKKRMKRGNTNGLGWEREDPVNNELMTLLRELHDVLLKMNFIAYPKIFLSEKLSEAEIKVAKEMVRVLTLHK